MTETANLPGESGSNEGETSHFIGESSVNVPETRGVSTVCRLCGIQRLPCVCGLSGGWAEAGGWRGRGYEHGLREAYGRREGACRLYTPVCQAGSALLDHPAVRHEPGTKKTDTYIFIDAI